MCDKNNGNWQRLSILKKRRKLYQHWEKEIKLFPSRDGYSKTRPDIAMLCKSWSSFLSWELLKSAIHLKPSQILKVYSLLAGTEVQHCLCKLPFCIGGPLN